ncbi:hypothetical protein JDW19_02385 [Paenibacillus polymyxa]|uniref:Uncharacterized protein n=1 Tax=Paenibacillus polymyxa TaxID=1406 RepID=A0A8I1LP25_PAEPO|nr:MULTISPECIES: hypothetical protein [unclassified Paenibacillus]KAF6576577.1 hypothetical protein G9G53_01305 [Paenibacillus sp. EKM206P]KAF6591289.1 hypothetical protein G9G52_02660 [Paenibacillus sp. EKM205P]MBM0631976.1 hypothetical protein [Paenibacillus polymyxa]
MKPIQYDSPNYQPLPGILSPVSIREFRGLNTYDPLSIDERFLTDMQNMTTSDYPAITTRPGYAVIGQAGNRVLGMGVWEGRELHVVFNDGTWRRWNGSDWATLVSGLNTSAEWTFTNFQGNLDRVNLIGCNGVDAMRRYDGGSVQWLGGSSPASGKYITTYQNRLWCAVGKELWASKLDNPTVWDSFLTEEGSYCRQMESSRGEQISMLTGSLTKLTIGMPNSLHELYGGLPSDFNTKLITEDMGPVANKATVTQEGFLRFIHRTGIYDYGGGTLPSKSFSDIIGTYLDGVTDQSAAGTDGTRMLFNIPGDKLLVYDPRPGIQAWSLWRGIQAVHFIQMGNKLYVGDAQGRVLRLEGQTDAGNAIAWSATTKPFNGGTIAQKQRWYKLWVVVELSGNMDIYVSSSISGNDWTLVNSISGSGAPQVRRVIIPVAKFTRENWIRVRFSGSGWARIHEFTRQVRQLPLY